MKDYTKRLKDRLLDDLLCGGCTHYVKIGDMSLLQTNGDINREESPFYLLCDICFPIMAACGRCEGLMYIHDMTLYEKKLFCDKCIRLVLLEIVKEE